MAVTIAPLVLGAIAMRRRLLGSWSGPPARLAESVIVIAALVLILQLLGLVGLLSALPVTLAGLLAGAALWRAGDGPRPSSPPPAPRAAGRLAPLAALAAGGLVLAEWSTRLLPAVDHGMTGADTVWSACPRRRGSSRTARSRTCSSSRPAPARPSTPLPRGCSTRSGCSGSATTSCRPS